MSRRRAGRGPQPLRFGVGGHDLHEQRAGVRVLPARPDRLAIARHRVPGGRERVDFHERRREHLCAGGPLRPRSAAASRRLPAPRLGTASGGGRSDRHGGRRRRGGCLRPARSPREAARERLRGRRRPTIVARPRPAEVRQLVREERSQFLGREDAGQRQRQVERPARDRPVEADQPRLGDGNPAPGPAGRRRLGAHRNRHGLARRRAPRAGDAGAGRRGSACGRRIWLSAYRRAPMAHTTAAASDHDERRGRPSDHLAEEQRGTHAQRRPRRGARRRGQSDVPDAGSTGADAGSAGPRRRRPPRCAASSAPETPQQRGPRPPVSQDGSHRVEGVVGAARPDRRRRAGVGAHSAQRKVGHDLLVHLLAADQELAAETGLPPIVELAPCCQRDRPAENRDGEDSDERPSEAMHAGALSRPADGRLPSPA